MVREDETIRRELYGGHPPACTCVDCQRKRLEKEKRRKHESFDPRFTSDGKIDRRFFPARFLGSKPSNLETEKDKKGESTVKRILKWIGIKS